jgi:hypothetical protein
MPNGPRVSPRTRACLLGGNNQDWRAWNVTRTGVPRDSVALKERQSSQEEFLPPPLTFRHFSGTLSLKEVSGVLPGCPSVRPTPDRM